MRVQAFWACLAFWLLAAGATAHAEECRPIPEGAEVNYLGRDLERNDVLLESMRGKIVVVAFWASYCQPCRQELPFLSNVQDQVGGDELQVVAVNLGENGRTVGQAYRAWKGWGDLLVTRDLRGRASRAMGVSYVPTTLVFDPRGEFVDASCGFTIDGFKKLVGRLNNLILAERGARESKATEEGKALEPS